MKRVEFLGKLQMVYVGDRNAFNEIVGEYDRVNNIINELSKDVDMWNKKYNEQFNIINELEKDINNQLMMTRKLDKYNEGFFNATLHFYNKLKALKEENK